MLYLIRFFSLVTTAILAGLEFHSLAIGLLVYMALMFLSEIIYELERKT